jgi:hypothetical protein
VSKKVMCWTGSGLDNKRVLHNSVVVGRTRNPDCHGQDSGVRGQSGVQEQCTSGR